MNTPINFDTAKLLKEKGFDKIGKFYYPDDGSLLNKNKNSTRHSAYRIQAPTIAEVVMWLYEKHGIWIVSIPSTIGEGFDCNYYVGKDKFGINKHPSFVINSPTEAYEVAIEYVLKELV